MFVGIGCGFFCFVIEEEVLLLRWVSLVWVVFVVWGLDCLLIEEEKVW